MLLNSRDVGIQSHDASSQEEGLSDVEQDTIGDVLFHDRLIERQYDTGDYEQNRAGRLRSLVHCSDHTDGAKYLLRSITETPCASIQPQNSCVFALFAVESNTRMLDVVAPARLLVLKMLELVPFGMNAKP